MIKHNANNNSKLRVLSEDELLAVVGGDGSSATGSDGSDPSSDSSSAVGADNIQKKHVSNIKWTPGKASDQSGSGSGG